MTFGLVALWQSANWFVCRKLGLKTGDLVAVIETREGVLITPQPVIAVKALDRIGEALRDQGITLEELIESGREVRAELIQEQYGIRSDTNRE